MKFIYNTTKGYRGQLFLLFCTVILSTITGSMFPYATGKIVDQIFYKQQMGGFLLYFFVYAGLYFLNQCMHGGLNYLWAKLEVTYVVSIRKKCFHHLQRLTAREWTDIKSGDVMNRIMYDTECFLEFIHRSIFYIIGNVVQLGISIGYLLFTNFYLGLTAIIMTPVMAWSIRYFAEKLKKKYGKIQKDRGLLDAWIQEMMVGISQWKLLHAEGKVEKDYHRKTQDIINEEKKTGYVEITSGSVNEALTLLGQLVIFAIAVFCVKDGTITIGQFVACAAYFSTCATYFNGLGKKINQISGNIVGIKRVEEIMDMEVEKEFPNASPHQIVDGSISVKDVKFGYNQDMVLKGLNLEIKAGEKVAFTGKSGEGKSTLLQLICRFYEPNSGQILIDGVNIDAFTLESLRSQVAVVWQENGLFHGSVRANITLSDNKEDDKRIWELLDGLKLKNLFDEYGTGLDMIIGGGDRELSGGQKQRIDIARCLYRNPKILLLDEATSALDAETEKAVNTFIYKQLPQTTILTVAHRFSTVMSAEKIAVLDGGKTLAVGTHEELVGSCKEYRQLYEEYQQSLSNRESEVEA